MPPSNLGVLMGARVVAAASSPSKLAVAAGAGAELLVDYGARDIRTALRDVAPGLSPDVIVDPVGGALSEAAFRSIAWGGRHLVIGFATGDIPALPLNLPLLKGAALIGVFWGASQARDPRSFYADLDRLYRWLGDGRLKPVIDRRFPLDQGPEALGVIMARRAEGKIVLLPWTSAV